MRYKTRTSYEKAMLSNVLDNLHILEDALMGLHTKGRLHLDHLTMRKPLHKAISELEGLRHSLDYCWSKRRPGNKFYEPDDE